MLNSLNTGLSKLRALPRRRSLGASALTVALVLSIWASLEQGLFAGVTLLIAASGLILALLQLLPVRPKLHITASGGGAELDVRPQKPVRPLDEDAIAAEQAGLCRKEMPRMPAPRVPPGSPAASLFASFQGASNLLAATSGVSEQSLYDFQAEVSEYTAKLRDWISRLEDARADRVRLFEGELRIDELGEAAADHVHLRLHFPPGFEPDEDPPEVGSPPERPSFNRFGGVRFRGLRNLDKLIAGPGSIRLPGTDKPKYSTEGGLTKVDFDLGRLNQSDHRGVPAFRLRAAAPGNYEVQWEATASGLNKPARGSLTLTVRELSEGEVIQSLDDADAERDAYDFL